VKKNADVNFPDGRSENTPLHYACASNHADIADFLIEHGVIN
jgi:ankyrin repeat protein